MADFVPSPQDSVPPGLSARATMFILSSLILGTAIHLTQGAYSPGGIALIGVSLLLTALATLGPARLDRGFLRPALAPNHTARTAIFVILMLVQVYRGFQTIRQTPQPNNDVWVFHTDSATALANRINPYTISFPNIYHPDVWVYAPEVVRGDRVIFGYPYPPLTLLCTSAGTLILGDCRYTMLLAVAITSALILAIRPDWIGLFIAAVFLYAPSYRFILEMGWTEPLHAMLLAGTILCAFRAPRLLGVMLGLLIASKQYLPAAVLLVPLLYMSRFHRNCSGRRLGGFDPIPRNESRGDGSHYSKANTALRDIGFALLVAIAITLPLALWDFESFYRSVVTLQLHQPFRKDALSFLNLWRFGREGWIGPSWVSFVAMIVAIALCYWRRAGFAAAFAFTFFTFFAFNKQAFANYYYLIIAALCLASAADGLNSGRGSADKS